MANFCKRRDAYLEDGSQYINGNMRPYVIEIQFSVTGTFHGSIITAKCEGDARRLFHSFYNGESIVTLKKIFIIGYLPPFQ